MNPNVDSISADRIKEIYNILADALIDGVEKGEVSEEDEKNSAEFMLQNLDSVKTQAELITFLEQLCKNWPTYNSVYHKLINEQKAVDDQAKIAEIEKSLNSIKSSI